MTRFETVHHSLKKETLYKMFDAIVPKHFESKISEQAVNFSDEARSELDFIKECLTSDVWGGCSRRSCPVYEHQENTGKYFNPHCFMPSKSLQSDGMITISMHNHEIPIFQVEIHGDKADKNKD